VLWEHGAAYDLNRLIGRFPVHLAEAFYISNRGQIACLGTLPNGDLRVVLLVPAGLAARQRLSATPATSLAPAQQPAAARSVPDPATTPPPSSGNWPQPLARGSSHDAHATQPPALTPTEAVTPKSLPTGEEQIRSPPGGRSLRLKDGRYAARPRAADDDSSTPAHHNGTANRVNGLNQVMDHTVIPAQSRGNQDAITRRSARGDLRGRPSSPPLVIGVRRARNCSGKSRLLSRVPLNFWRRSRWPSGHLHVSRWLTEVTFSANRPDAPATAGNVWVAGCGDCQLPDDERVAAAVACGQPDRAQRDVPLPGFPDGKQVAVPARSIGLREHH